MMALKNKAIIQVIIIITFIISACAPSPNLSTQAPTITAIIDSINAVDISGRVVDINGLPVPDANISTDKSRALSDDQGWFHIASTGIPQWVTITKQGYISRTRAAEPGVPVLIRISPDDGKTIVLKFAGDVMFGRRFFDPNEDGDPSDGLLPINPSIEDHLKLLAPIRPLLENSDLTAVNLESVIDDHAYFSARDVRPSAYHPTKDYVYATHPNAIFAMLQSGIKLVGIGNNHVYDMLELGMTNTISDLDKARMYHFGAGINETEAWTPAIINVKGQKIAFVACTTIFGSSSIVNGNEITYTASDAQKKGGAALCEENKLKTAVTQAKQMADSVVVMVHGGFEYERGLAGNPMRFTLIAKQAGATIVVNHHSHVVSGLTWSKGAITAWALGNFISDQTVWPTFESYMLTVYVREGQIIRAFIEPVMLKDYVARGVTSELADYVVRGAAGREPGPFIVESGAMEVDINQTAIQKTKQVTLDGGTGTIIPIAQGQWLSDFQGTGSLVLGRDLLWVGSFENSVVDNKPGLLPLWKQGETSNIKVGAEYAYEGQAGIRLTRGSSNQAATVTTNLHRILVNSGSNLTISGMVRGSQGALVSLQASWYPDTIGSSISQTSDLLDIKEAGVWQPFQFNVQVPEGIAALGIFLKLSPPVTGISTADFDNIRVIEWAPPQSPFSVSYNFAYLVGSGDLTFSQAVLPGGEDWITLSR